MSAPGDRLRLTVDRLAAGGESLGRAPDGRLVFFRGGAPGDVVDVRVVTAEARRLTAHLVERVSPGPDHVASFCADGERCGGCPWQNARPAAQHAALAAHVERALTQAAGHPFVAPPGRRPTDPFVAPPGRRPTDPFVLEPFVPASPSIGWRSTARLQIVDGAVGYFAPGSHTLVEPTVCAALSPVVSTLLAHLRAVLVGQGNRAPKGRGVVRLTGAAAAPEATGTVTLEPGEGADTSAWALLAAALLGGPCHGVRLRGSDRSPERTWGVAEDIFGPQAVPHPAGSFVQAHQPGTARLVQTACDWLLSPPARPTRVLELYAGSGNFTFALGAAGGAQLALTALEIDPAAAARLRAEGLRRGLTLTVQTGDAAHLPTGRWDAVLLDPPRAGARAVMPLLVRLRPRRIVYVACDVATLARDVKTLVSAGARVERIRVFDLFPHTGHVETVVRLAFDGPRR